MDEDTDKHNENSRIPVVHNHSLTTLFVVWDSRKGLAVKLDAFRKRVGEERNVRRVIVLTIDRVDGVSVDNPDFIARTGNRRRVTNAFIVTQSENRLHRMQHSKNAK